MSLAMNRELKKKILVFVSLVILAVTGVFIHSRINLAANTVYINGKTYQLEGLRGRLSADFLKEHPVFTETELNEFVTYKFSLDNIDSRNFSTKVSDYIHNQDYEIDCTYEVDYDGIQTWIANYNKKAVKSEDAYIKAGKNNYKVVDEVYGSELNFDLLKPLLEEGSYDIALSDFTDKPNVLGKSLKKHVKKLNKFVNWSYKYTNGESLESSISYVKNIDGKVVLDDTWIDESVRNILGSYNTVGQTRSFTTHDGNNIQISGGTWGSYVDYDAEIVKVKEAFASGKSVNDATPEYSYNREEIGDTYVEVSIVNQHVWVYQNGKLTMDSPIVTGTLGVHNTPTGIYYMMECLKDYIMRGADYVSHADRWMRLTYSGIGLHDATWRSQFGGNIYTYSGSHGCINLPLSFAYQLFDIAYVGMPVIVY